MHYRFSRLREGGRETKAMFTVQPAGKCRPKLGQEMGSSFPHCHPTDTLCSPPFFHGSSPFSTFPPFPNDSSGSYGLPRAWHKGWKELTKSSLFRPPWDTNHPMDGCVLLRKEGVLATFSLQYLLLPQYTPLYFSGATGCSCSQPARLWAWSGRAELCPKVLAPTSISTLACN